MTPAEKYAARREQNRQLRDPNGPGIPDQYPGGPRAVLRDLHLTPPRDSHRMTYEEVEDFVFDLCRKRLARARGARDLTVGGAA